MLKVYWKVHINNFDSFIDYILKEYKNFSNITNNFNHYRYYYAGNKYLYLLIYDTFDKSEYHLAYSGFSVNSLRWFDANEYTYMGEFNGRKDKLKVLNDISNGIIE